VPPRKWIGSVPKTSGPANVTPVQVNIASGAKGGIVVSAKLTDMVGVKVPAPVQFGAGMAEASNGATRTTGINNRALLRKDLVFIFSLS